MRGDLYLVWTTFIQARTIGHVFNQTVHYERNGLAAIESAHINRDIFYAHKYLIALLGFEATEHRHFDLE